MGFLEALGVIKLGRDGAKALRKPEVIDVCFTCTEKRLGKHYKHVLKTPFIPANDEEELRFRTKDKNILIRGFGFAIQKVGLLECFNHLDNSFIYRCKECGNLAVMRRRDCM